MLKKSLKNAGLTHQGPAGGPKTGVFHAMCLKRVNDRGLEHFTNGLPGTPSRRNRGRICCARPSIGPCGPICRAIRCATRHTTAASGHRPLEAGDPARPERSWLRKRMQAPVRPAAGRSRRSARPSTAECQLEPADSRLLSSSALGTNAAAESTTIRSSARERTSLRAISRACSPHSGRTTTSFSRETPSAAARFASKVWSASIHPAAPPERCSHATVRRARVVLPEDSDRRSPRWRARKASADQVVDSGIAGRERRKGSRRSGTGTAEP